MSRSVPDHQPTASPDADGARRERARRDGALRVIIEQPALPHYRVPVFAALARRPGIDLRVAYGELPNLPNADPEGFAAELAAPRRLRVPGRTLTWQPAQWRSAARGSADVLILSWGLNSLSLVPALLRARRHSIPTILWGHGYSKREAAWREAARFRVTALATALLFYDQATARRATLRGVASERVFVALNSLDQGPITRAREAWSDDLLAEFRRSERLERGPIVLFVSRLARENRLELLLEAAALLRREFPELQVLIVGRGPDESRLRELTGALRLGEIVRFLGPIYEESRLAPLFMSAAAFAYPCNIGLSLLHAFGYGLPVVTSDRRAAQNPEIEALRHGANGLLYRHGDAAALAAALRQIMADPALRLRLSQEARRTVREEFTLEKMVDGMEQAVRWGAGRGRVSNEP